MVLYKTKNIDWRIRPFAMMWLLLLTGAGVIVANIHQNCNDVKL